MPPKGIYRGRVIYSDRLHAFESLPYHKHQAQNFALVVQAFNYDYKYADRSALNHARAEYNQYDDIIFIKEGHITDTTIANIAIYEKGAWLTPSVPMLYGTTRERLLDEKKLQTADISVDRLFNADKIALMNALSGFYELSHAKIHFCKG